MSWGLANLTGRRTGQLAVYADLAEYAARDDRSVPEKSIEYRLHRVAAYSLVDDRVQRFDDVKVDVIVVVAKTSFAPWDGARKRT